VSTKGEFPPRKIGQDTEVVLNFLSKQPINRAIPFQQHSGVRKATKQASCWEEIRCNGAEYTAARSDKKMIDKTNRASDLITTSVLGCYSGGTLNTSASAASTHRKTVVS
jgi:hypothetical protein